LTSHADTGQSACPLLILLYGKVSMQKKKQQRMIDAVEYGFLMWHLSVMYVLQFNIVNCSAPVLHND